MKVTLTITRTFEIDDVRVLTEPSFTPPPPQTAIDDVRRYLQESFYELCGVDRYDDHVDGSYVRRVSEDVEAEWYWPRHLDNFARAGDDAHRNRGDS